jgi:hypothetical protein
MAALSFTLSAYLIFYTIPADCFSILPIASDRSCALSMVDKSCVTTFSVGETVCVVTDVYKAGMNLRGTIGTVVETWEKCNVDPTCCCAEFVDDGYAVRVEFQPNESKLSEDDVSNQWIHDISKFRHYFSVDEIQKIE